jgi:predicted Rossmann fold flavoprotein
MYVGGKLRVKLQGNWLWTHFGASGPLALDLSRHWLRAELEGTPPEVFLSICPGETFESVDTWLLDQSRERPRARVAGVLSGRVPASVAATWLSLTSIADDALLAHLPRDDRRRLVHAMTAMRVRIRGSRGYQYAEVTAGGVALEEIDPATMASRVCPGLYLVGEIVDVDGRLGGFNFQWAWSSGYVAGCAVARALTPGR